MGVAYIRQLPNAISGMRIVLSITLFFLIQWPLAFSVAYFFCGLSDLADGYLARRFKLETAIGAKLDSVADFVFVAAGIIIILTSVHIENKMLLLAVIILVAIIRAANLIMTKQKFRQWGVIHTVANKITGVVLFLAIPICIWTNSVPLWLITTVGIVAALSATEELAILLMLEEYDAIRKGYFARTGQL